MSILIKGIEMPVTCCHCPLMGYDPDREWHDGMARTGAHICVLTGELIDNTKREEHCPLVPVPPHGRLIDADALLARFDKESSAADAHGQDFSTCFMRGLEPCAEWWAVEQMVMDAPTIVPAEPEEEKMK